MGSIIEFNDTLLLTAGQGFPSDILDLEKHQKKAITIDEIGDRVFAFKGKDGARFFHPDPCRVYLVQNIGGKWLFWGRVMIQSQTIYKKLDEMGNWVQGEWLTSGTYKILDVYDPEFQKEFTMKEAPAGKNYLFDQGVTG